MSSLSLLFASALRLLWVDPYGETPYLPEADPTGGVETNVLSCAAAKGEIESLSFVVVPDGDLPKVDFRPTELTGPGGAKIPASAADFAQVKVWYRAGGRWWNSWCGDQSKPEAVNELILHDDTLVKVDASAKANFLRGDYAGGTVYLNMSAPGRNTRFEHSLHPVRDTKAFVPFDLRRGRRQQYWLTWKVPADAKPGVYRGTLEVTSAGAALQTIPLELEVYPFELPYARTHYDTSKEYFSYWMGVPYLEKLLKGSKRLDVAEAKLRAIARSLVEHNVTSPNGPGDFKTDTTDDLAVRSLIILRQEGMACREPINGRSFVPGWNFRGLAAPATPEKDPELFQKSLEEFTDYFNLQVSVLDRYLGHHNCLFQSIDECGTATNVRNFPFWEIVRRGGCGTWTDSGRPFDIGWNVTGNDIPASCSPYAAWQWHRAGAKAYTYAGPFTGPICPDTWRRTKGLRYYYADFDGLHEYEFFSDAHNRWNDSIKHDRYCQFGIVYLTQDGLIPTVSWEAVREALDDVRYLSLLRLRAEAALASADPKVRQLGKREIKWMDAVDPESVFDLHAFRREVVAHIRGLMDAVGPQPADPPPVKAAPELPRCTCGDGCPLTLATAAEFEKADRYDLAMPVYEKLVANKELSPKERLTATVALARLQMELLQRASAVKTLDTALKTGGFPSQMRNRLTLAKARMLLADEVFEEQMSIERLREVELLAKPLVEKKDLDGADRYSVVFTILKSYEDSGFHREAVRFAAERIKAGGIIRKDVAEMELIVAEAHMALKEWAKALKAFDRAHAGLGKSGNWKRRVYEREVLAAEQGEDWARAARLWDELSRCYDKVEETGKIKGAKENAKKAGAKCAKPKASAGAGGPELPGGGLDLDF